MMTATEKICADLYEIRPINHCHVCMRLAALVVLPEALQTCHAATGCGVGNFNITVES